MSLCWDCCSQSLGSIHGEPTYTKTTHRRRFYLGFRFEWVKRDPLSIKHETQECLSNGHGELRSFQTNLQLFRIRGLRTDILNMDYQVFAYVLNRNLSVLLNPMLYGLMVMQMMRSAISSIQVVHLECMMQLTSVERQEMIATYK